MIQARKIAYSHLVLGLIYLFHLDFFRETSIIDS